VGIFTFATGKDLPAILGKGTERIPSANSPSAHPPQSTPTTRRTAIAGSSHKPTMRRPTAKAGAPPTPTTMVTLPPTNAPAVNPVVNGLSAPSSAEIKACIQQRALDTNLADYGLNDANLGEPATLKIKVGVGDYTYRLIAADSSCQPTTLVTVYPGQSA